MNSLRKVLLVLTIICAALLAYLKYADDKAGPNAGLGAALFYGIVGGLVIIVGAIFLFVFSTLSLIDVLKNIRIRKAANPMERSLTLSDMMQLTLYIILLVASIYPFVLELTSVFIHS